MISVDFPIEKTKASSSPSVSDHMLGVFEVLLKNLNIEDRERLKAALIEYGIRPEAL